MGKVTIYSNVGWGTATQPNGITTLVFQLSPDEQIHFPLGAEAAKKMGTELLAPSIAAASPADVARLGDNVTKIRRT